MIERLTDLPAGVDGLRAKGKITREDYDCVLQRLLDEARSQGRRVRLLYQLGPEAELRPFGYDELDRAVSWASGDAGDK